MIEITELAVEKIKDVLKEHSQDGSSLRVIVAPGAHGSVQYMLSLEEEAHEDDTVIQVDGIRVLVDSQSTPLVEGAQIDYLDGLMRSGFVISNPNIQTGGGGCGCGSGGGGGCGSGGGGCGCGAGH